MRVLIVSIICLLLSNQAIAQGNDQSFKLGAEYKIPKKQNIKLRITEIPQKLPWLERDDNGKVIAPNKGSIVSAETVQAMTIKSPYGEDLLLPEGTKFYARVTEKNSAKSFWGRAKARLEFFRIEIPNHGITEYILNHSLASYDSKNFIQPQINNKSNSILIEDEDISFELANKGKLVNGIKNIGKIGAYTLGGAIAAPLAVFTISSNKILSTAALSNPYIIGTATALGGGAGLIYGLKHKGDKLKLEPGTEVKVSLNDTWFLTQHLKQVSNSTLKAFGKEDDQNFKLEVLKIKKAKGSFDDACLKISIKYENMSNEELRYTSFQLVDSMGKEYEPNTKSFDQNSFGELPQKGKLDLYFNSDFPKAIHQLKVLRQYDQKTLAIARVAL